MLVKSTVVRDCCSQCSFLCSLLFISLFTVWFPLVSFFVHYFFLLFISFLFISLVHCFFVPLISFPLISLLSYRLLPPFRSPSLPSTARFPSAAPCSAESGTRRPADCAGRRPYSRSRSTDSPAPSRTDSPPRPRTDAAPTPPPLPPTAACADTAAPRAPDGNPPNAAMGSACAASRRDICSPLPFAPYFPVRLKSRHSSASGAANRFNSPGLSGSNPGMATFYSFFSFAPATTNDSPFRKIRHTGICSSSALLKPTFPLRIRSTTASM